MDELPQYDDPDLDVGDLGIKANAGTSRATSGSTSPGGSWTACSRESKPGRSPDGIGATMDALGRQTRVLAEAVDRRGWSLISIGWHPYCTGYTASPRTTRELQFREAHTEYAAPDVYMSYGPDLNLSQPGASDADAVDLVRKLTFTVRCWFRSRSARRFSAADRLACSRCGPTTGRDDVRQLAPSSIPRVPCWWVTRRPR